MSLNIKRIIFIYNNLYMVIEYMKIFKGGIVMKKRKNYLLLSFVILPSNFASDIKNNE